MTPIPEKQYAAHVRLLAGMEAEEAAELLTRVEELHGVAEADRLRADARAYYRAQEMERRKAFERMAAPAANGGRAFNQSGARGARRRA